MASKGFSYQKTDLLYISYYNNGQWDEGKLIKEDQIEISLMSTVLHYGQSAFEGLKAYRRKDGDVQLFRVKDNAARFKSSCERIVMPVFPEDRFFDAVVQVVLANLKFVPPYQSGTLYIRPVMFGVGDNLGLKPASSYVFAVIVSPVGSYFDANKTADLLITDYDRVAHHGTGKAKTGGNYSASMLPQKMARAKGYTDVLFLDPIHHENIEEVGAANFLGITDANELYTPVSESILDGITKRSILYIAKHFLNMNVYETVIPYSHIDQFVEAAACGTAAVITPIGSTTKDGVKHFFKHHVKMGPVTTKLYNLLTGIQCGDVEDPNHWITLIKA